MGSNIAFEDSSPTWRGVFFIPIAHLTQICDNPGVIQIICDQCEHAFEVGDDQAGGKVKCPRCGDVNRVPGPVPSPGPAAAAAGKTSPGVRRDEPERELMVVRTAMFRAHPWWYSLMILIGLAGIGLMIMTPSTPQLPRWSAWAGLAMLGVAVLWWLFWWGAPHRWVKLIITNKRTIRHEGIVMRRTSEVLHNHIRNIKIEQSVMGRILGTGSLSIDSAGGAEGELVEIQMRGVPRPYEIKALIDQHRRL